jgi:tetratricopeptide (TPR) repeat protein
MPLDFNEHLLLVQAAQGDPALLALATLDIVLASQPPELRRVVEAAAVPHWFDETLFHLILDDDLRAESGRWYAAVIALPLVEAIPARQGFNIHETARLALRRQMFTERPERFCELSERAAAAFSGPAVHDQIEHVYHLVVAAPAKGSFALRDLNVRLTGSVEASLALTSAIEEYGRDVVWPALARGWAFLLSAWNRKALRPEQTSADASKAFWAFMETETDWAIKLAQVKLGETALTTGDLSEAQRLFTESLLLAQCLTESDPANAFWQRGVTLSLNRLGGLAVAQGDLIAAEGHFTASYKNSERLMVLDPANADWQRDLAFCLCSLGDVAFAQRDLTAASRYFNASLEISERLTASDPANADWQRDLAGILIRLGDLAVAQGEGTAAAQHFDASVKIRERLAASDPANAILLRDLYVALEKHGSLAVPLKDMPITQRYVAGGLKISESLGVSDPDNATWQRDLWVSYWRLANLMERQCQPEAGAYWGKAYDIVAGMKQARRKWDQGKQQPKKTEFSE